MRIALGLLIIILGLLMGYSASRYKAPEIQADIDIRTNADLASLEIAGKLIIETDGRHVTLRGVAADQAEKDQILERAKEVWGVLGPIDEIKLLEVEAPHKLSVVKGQGRAGSSMISPPLPSDVRRTRTFISRSAAIPIRKVPMT